MKARKNIHVVLAIFLLFVMACNMSSVTTATETPTKTAIPPTLTKTKKPTSTPRPTATPNVAATQKYDEFNTLLEEIKSNGYISTTAGDASEIDDFKEDWAQMNWFQSWGYGEVSSEFVFKSKFKWTTASSTPEQSGCGVIFGGQENGDYYALFLTNQNIRFFMKRGANLYNVGKTSGSGAQAFGNPAEADFVLAVSDQKAFVSVNGEKTLYTLSQDQTTKGVFGLSLLSGTNKDYGTRCEATDMMLWNSNK
ncbi:MAG: hypothetical protein U0Z26_03970 [Anaerolineales bacterium]